MRGKCDYGTQDDNLKLPWFLVFLVSFFVSCEVVAASAMRVGVIYPQLQGGYSEVFNSLLDGVKDAPGLEVNIYPLSDTASQQEVDVWLTARRIQGVIALGQRSSVFAERLANNIPVVYGAVLIAPSGKGGISLAGDPDQFFSQLSSLAPQVKRVFTIYSDLNSSWLIRQARESAQRHGLELVAYPAQDVRESAAHLRTILQQSRSDIDSIWLQLDGVVPDRTAMPLILEAAWERRLVVFSNNPIHVKRGALFSLNPDYRLMGRRLGELIQQQGRTDAKPVMHSSKSLRMTLNDRTADHLGLQLSKQQLKDVILVSPQP